MRSELEKIEVSIRTQLSYIQTTHSDIFWCANSVNFCHRKYSDIDGKCKTSCPFGRHCRYERCKVP
ncbi:hypothetical protein [Alistipes putredinis]|uniref:hypothetical protein n=1 Tax=Alistipes putredinis TaxID=28117 RepID=UPI003C6C7D6B